MFSHYIPWTLRNCY